MYRPSHIVSKEFSGSHVVVLDLRSGCYYTLNSTACQVWKGLDAGKEITQVCSCLEARPGAVAAQVATDVDAVVRRFVELGLLAEGEPAGKRLALPTGGSSPGSGGVDEPTADSLSPPSLMSSLEVKGEGDGADGPYEAPEVRVHDAVETVTAGTSGVYYYVVYYYVYYYYYY